MERRLGTAACKASFSRSLRFFSTSQDQRTRCISFVETLLQSSSFLTLRFCAFATKSRSLAWLPSEFLRQRHGRHPPASAISFQKFSAVEANIYSQNAPTMAGTWDGFEETGSKQDVWATKPSLGLLRRLAKGKNPD